LVWTGTTGEGSPVLPTQTTGTTGTLLKLRNQRFASCDFRSEFYLTTEDDVDEVYELSFLVPSPRVDRAPTTYERDMKEGEHKEQVISQVNTNNNNNKHAGHTI
jgi:hypothetical protein